MLHVLFLFIELFFLSSFWLFFFFFFFQAEDGIRDRTVTGVQTCALPIYLETLHALAQFPSGTRVGVASTTAETAHNLEHSIANAGLPNITLVGACPAEGAALGRLLRRVDVMVCPTGEAERVRGLAGSTVQVMIDDRALDQRAIEMLAALLVRENGDGPTEAPAPGRLRPRPSIGRKSRGA